MKVTFWGVRGSIPTPGRETMKYGGNSSCVEVQLADGHRIILDAGTGIRKLGQKMMKEKKPQDFHLLLSHGHMDHVHGFPFFTPAYIGVNHITLAGCPRGGKKVRDMLKKQMGDIYFPVEYEGLHAKIDQHTYCQGDVLKIKKAKVFTREINHPGQGISFRIEEKGKSVVYMTDNELHASWKNAFPFEAFRDFAAGADILIHDTQYAPKEYERQTRGWGHSTYEDVAQLAAEAKVKKFILFHHDPDRTDAKVEWMREKTREAIRKHGGRGIGVVAAREGATVAL